METPSYLRVARALALASSSALLGCGDRTTTGTDVTVNGPLCVCVDDAGQTTTQHGESCTPAEQDAGCSLRPGLGGPLPPPDLAVA